MIYKDEHVIVIDNPVIPNLTPCFGKLLFQFNAATQFYWFIVNQNKRASAKDGWRPPTRYGVSAAVKYFRDNHERRDEISYELIQSISGLIVHMINAYMLKPDRDTNLHIPPITELRLRVGKPVSRTLSNGSIAQYETGTLRFQAAEAIRFARDNEIPDDCTVLHVGGVGVIVVRMKDVDIPDGYEHKQFALIKDDNLISLRVIVAPADSDPSPFTVKGKNLEKLIEGRIADA